MLPPADTVFSAIGFNAVGFTGCVDRLVVPSATELLRRTVDFSPEQVSFLQFGRVADTTAARVELGFSPRWSSLQAFEDFAAARLTGVVTEERVARVERDVLNALRAAAAWFSREVRA